MNFRRLDKFIDDTSFLWFLALIMVFGFLKWLIIWACYELLMSVLIDEKPKKKKKKVKKETQEVKERTYI